MLTKEQTMTKEMPMNNEFVGEMRKKEMTNKDCAIMGIIKNQIIELQEELTDMKIKYADASLQEKNWYSKYEHKMACKINEGKICVLKKIQKDFENMLMPVMASV